MKSVGKFQEIIVYFANGLIFWFPARLDESLDKLIPQGAEFLRVRP